MPPKLARTVRITKGYLSSLLAAQGDSVFLKADEEIVRVVGHTGREVWRVPAEGFGIACVVADTLLITNKTWTAGRGISIESGRAIYSLSARNLWLWRDRWMLMKDGSVVFADPATGDALKTRSPLPLAPSDAGLVRIEGDVMLYQAEDNTQAVAYDLSRQEPLWKRPLPREIAERCGCEVGVVVLRPVEPKMFLAHVTSRVVAGCSLADGSILWDMAVPLQSPVVPHGDRVYVMAHQSRASPRLVCLDAATGAQTYDVSQPELDGLDFADHGRVHGDHIAFGTRGGLVGLFRLADGGLAWSYRYTVRRRTSVWVHTPVVAEERMYACADDGNLLIFETA
jgi:outer membrane protein assembly factor BamB